MRVRIIFAGLLGLVVMLPLVACSEPPTDYEKGLAAGKAQDYPEALRWYRKAAEQGDAPAQNNLGVMYEEGRGVAQDYAEALRWYHKAAQQGNADAQHNLGNMYESGLGVKQDDREAVRWWRKAAEQGNSGAQSLLGLMYIAGRGIEKDYVQALKWFNIASALGNKSTKKIAKTGREVAEKNMSAQQIDQAQTEATKWLETH